MRTFLVFVSGLVAAVLITGCTQSRKPQPNIVVVMIDTLRFDRLGAYGNDKNLTPFLDSLAARGHVFRRAYAQSSWTNPSVASFLTSRYQSQHHVFSFGSNLSEDELTLPEILQGEGYATGAFCANFLVLPKKGFAQGFDAFEVVVRREGNRFIKGRADAIHQAALAWLDKEQPEGNDRKPFFLYLHYMEPHAPYDPPLELVDRASQGHEQPNIDNVKQWLRRDLNPFTEQMLRAAEDLYDAEVMSLDAELRAMFAELEKRGLLENTIVVIVADHGEEFYEHGMVGHHQTLFEEVIRVPLIIIPPGGEGRTDVDEIVESVDIAPTLLDFLDIDRPAAFEGSVLPSFGKEPAGHWLGLGPSPTNPPAEPRRAFSELKAKENQRRTPHEHAAIVDGEKLIVGVDGERDYFNLHSDPGEKDAVSPDEGMRARLDGAMEQLYAYGSKTAPKAVTVDAETKERMRALGYD